MSGKIGVISLVGGGVRILFKDGGELNLAGGDVDALRLALAEVDNPQPRAITADQCNDIEDAVHEGVPLGHMLRRLGIEVVDDE